MKQASGHEVKSKEYWVCLLVKALYGTKQAAHTLKKHLKKLMVHEGLTRSGYQLHQGNAFVHFGSGRRICRV